MPSPAAEPVREARRSVEFEGTVCSGLGEGARFTALDWVGEEFRRRLGFDAWPGTLNLRLDGAAWSQWRSQLQHHPGIPIQPAPGFCPAKCFEALLDGRVRAAAVIPDVGGYPADKLELVAPSALRRVLGLADGDRLRIRLSF